MKIYQHILQAISQGKRVLAVLMDPDKMQVDNVKSFIEKVNKTKADYLFVGGSIVKEKATEALVSEIKKIRPEAESQKKYQQAGDDPLLRFVPAARR